MKHKLSKKIFALGGAALLCSCGSTSNSVKIDAGKTQIYIQMYAGGFGSEYLQSMMDAWNAKSDKYQLVLTSPNLFSSGNDLTALQTGTKVDVFWSSFVDYQTGFYAKGDGYFEDLSPILERKPDGEGGLSVREKIIDKGAWLGGATQKNGEGCYMLPNTSTIAGIIFDYDLFVQQDWLKAAPVSEKGAVEQDGIACHEEGGKLIFDSSSDPDCFYRKGDTIMIASHDGHYGTYDDGQPVSLSDFEAMLSYLDADGYTPIAYAGQDVGYLDPLAESYFAQLIGEESYSQFLNFDSEGKNFTFVDANGGESQRPLTIDNGYQAYSTKGYDETIDYMERYFFGSYVGDYSKTGAKTVDDLQSTYLKNFQLTSKKNLCFASIVSGNWFETEAKSFIQRIGSNNPGRGYGDQRFRIMLTPRAEGATSKKTIMSALEVGGLLVKKQGDAEKKNAIFDFIESTLTNENLAKTASNYGLIRPYSFTMSKEQKEAMTPFNRYCYTLAQDTDNVTVLTSRLSRLNAPMAYAQGSCTIGTAMPFGRMATSILSAMRTESADALKKSTKSMYDPALWAAGVAQCRSGGFYGAKN